MLLEPFDERKPLEVISADPIGPFTVFITEDGSSLPKIPKYATAKDIADLYSAARIFDRGHGGIIYVSTLKNS